MTKGFKVLAMSWRVSLAALMAAVTVVAAYAVKPIKVACVGNSITYGYLLPDREVNCYPSQLQRMLGDGYEVRNFGRSRATLLRAGHFPYVDQPEYSSALSYKPDIVVIHLGVNDTDPRNWPNYNDRFVSDYVALVDTFRAVNPDVRVILSRLTPLGASHHRFKSGTRDWRDEAQPAIERVAEATGSEVIDFGAALRDHSNLMPDAIHPDVKGAEILARTAYSGITGDYGGLRLPAIYQPGMVIQRNKPITINGKANAGVTVRAKIGENSGSSVADNRGDWTITLPAMTEGTGYELTVTDGTETVRIDDVAVGEVWLASGQSNMEFRLSNSVPRHKIDADNMLRLYDMKARYITDGRKWPDEALEAVNNLDYFVPTHWQKCDSASASRFSAIAYYFGKMLRDSLPNVPIGVICNAVGGSGTESWIDVETLEHGLPEILLNWRGNDYVQPWAQRRAAENSGTAAGQRHPYEPSYLFASGIRPLGHYPIAGVIWYQGESNAHNIEVHEALFGLLIESWRNYFDNAELPFYFAQLSSLNRPSWPQFRDSQRRLADRYEGVEMAVTHDYGDSLDVHPRNKKPVGERLGRIALNKLYGFGNVASSGPVPMKAVRDGNAIRISMANGNGMHASDGGALRTFEVARIDGLYYPAEATVENNEIIVRNMKVDNPCCVRYAWQPFTRANLVNEDGLPASTFKIEAEEPSFDDRGIESGVSACFAGGVGDKVIMAGGCNFPVNPLGSDSKKKFYSGIYELTPGNDGGYERTLIGRLPQPMAYGASAVTADGTMIMVGGVSDSGALSEAWQLRVTDGKAVITPLPSLPFTMDNMACCALGRKIYLAGGNVDGAPSNVLICLDLDKCEEGWKRLRDIPGNNRVQPVMAASGDKIYLWGGFAGKTADNPATLELGGCEYDVKSNKWRNIAGPRAASGDDLSVGGGMASTLADGRILVVGGVNKDVFLSALQNQQPDYLSHPIEWYRFNGDVLLFDPSEKKWSVIASGSEFARAGVALAVLGNKVYVIGGELKPRIRTPKVSVVSVD